MDLKEARQIVSKYLGLPADFKLQDILVLAEILSHGDGAIGFLAGHAAVTKAAEPLLDVIAEITADLSNLLVVLPESDFPKTHAEVKKFLSSSSHVVAEYSKNTLGEK